MRRAARILLLAWVGAAPVGASTEPPAEYRVKAAFLYNFAKFIEWPPSAFSHPQAPLTLCVLGQDPFGTALEELIAGERLGGRLLTVSRFATADAAPGSCHVAFVAPSARAHFPAVLKRLDTRRTLTVSEVPDFLTAGGHISFFMDGPRVRFAVNLPALERSEFQISSKLLRVARIERGGQP